MSALKPGSFIVQSSYTILVYKTTKMQTAKGKTQRESEPRCRKTNKYDSTDRQY